MSEANDGLQIVTVPAGGWCDPNTGLCHTADEADNDDAAGEVPDATDR